MTTWNNALNVRNPIYKLYDYKRNNGSIEYLSVSNLKLFKEVASVPTLVSGTAFASNNIQFMTYKDRNINDVVLLADGGTLKVYNGSSVAAVTPHVPTTEEQTDPGLNDLTNLTNCRAMAIKKDRIFLVGHPTVKNRVHFSFVDPVIGFATYDYFPSIYFFDVAVDDNDEIVNLKVFRNMLIIFCKKSVWALKGDGASLTDLELIKLNVPDGCISPESIQVVGNNLFYLGATHVYSLFATVEEFVSGQIMSDRLKPLLSNIGLTDKALAISTFYDSKYYLSFPSGVTLVWDSILESWTKYTNIKANSFLVRDEILYFSTKEGQIYKFNENIYNDNSDPINFSMKTKIVNFGAPVNKKKFRRLWVMSKQFDNFNSTFSMQMILDQNILESVDHVQSKISSGVSGSWDESFWDDASWDFAESIQNELKIKKKAKDIQFQIINNNLNEPLSVFGMVVEYELKKP